MSDQEQQQVLKDLLRERLQGPGEGLSAFLETVHGADLAKWMQDLSEAEAFRVFDCLEVEERAEVLEHAEDPLRELLVEHLTPGQLGEVVEELPDDEAVDLLALAGARTTEEVLNAVDTERAADLRELASHAHDTAGGLMTTEFVSVPKGTRIGDAIKLIKTEGEGVEGGQGLFVVDDVDRPVGYLSDRMLLTHSIHESVDEVMAEPIAVAVAVDQEEAAQQIEHYGLTELAVVDASGALVGVIAADDALEVLGDEAAEDMLKLVGTSLVQQTRLPVLQRVLGRLPLQGVTVAGGLVTAQIIDYTLDVPSTGAHLLRFVPLVIGLAGNVGIQSSTILVRAFATGEVEPDRELAVLGSETLVGLLIGTVCGAIALGVIAFAGGASGAAAFPLAVGVAITSAVTWAALLGCMVPMVCRRVGIDPAIVAGPFLITVSDVSGTGLFLSVAHLLLNV